MKFEVYPTFEMYRGRQWRWRLVGANGEPLASGESYHNRQDCVHVVGLLKRTGIFTPINFTTS